MSTDEGLLPASARADDASRADAPAARTPPGGRRRASRRLLRRRTARADRRTRASSGPGPGAAAAPGPGRSAAPAARFWQRAHPVFVPLTGFFTGVVVLLVVLGLLGWLLDDAFGLDVAAHPWVFAVGLGGLLLVNVALLLGRGTRRFARYMLLGVLVTPVVVATAAAVTLLVLIGQDG